MGTAVFILILLGCVLLVALFVRNDLAEPSPALVASGATAEEVEAQDGARGPGSDGRARLSVELTLEDAVLREDTRERPSDARWIAPGERVRVAGRVIPGGCIYVGRSLPALDRWRGMEPALIDPTLEVAASGPDLDGRWMSYWPSYSEIEPSCRAAYLKWLAEGRRTPGAYIGYVFLFFYGIERRILEDARRSDEAAAEVPALLAEIEELLEVYAGNDSFRRYATRFLVFARLLHGMTVDEAAVGRIEETPGPSGFAMRYELARRIEAGRPIPPSLALAWWRESPVSRPRTPAVRCPEEFADLFRLRYRERFRDGGMKVRAAKKPLEAVYRPASASFGRAVNLTFPGLSETGHLKAPVGKLQKVADDVMNELDAFSRWVGRHDEGTSLGAWALLPPELALSRLPKQARELLDWAAGELAGASRAPVETSELLTRWPLAKTDRASKREVEALARALGRLGLGVEPDVRFGGPNLSRARRIVLFALAETDVEESPEPRADYFAATLLLHLAAAVAAADGEVRESEERHLAAHLESSLELEAAERQRLEAHLAWLLTDPPGLAGVKKRVEPLARSERLGIGRFLIGLAGADGHVDPAELEILSKIFPVLGLPAEEVYSEVHALASGRVGEASSPGGTVTAAAPAAAERAAREPEDIAGVELDLAKVRALREQSRRSQSLLAEIFSEDEPEPEQELEAGPGAEELEEETGERLAGLDAAHSRLLREVARRDAWPRHEIEQLARRLDLLPDGAIEMLNEAAFERAGDPLLEGGETLELDREVLEEMST